MQTRDYLDLRDKLLNRLEQEMKQRPKRALAVWIHEERMAMFEVVNQERYKLGKPSIDLYEIFQIENTCVGHVDYASKFALRCAELTVYK